MKFPHRHLVNPRILAYNNDVTSGDIAWFFYVTLYKTEHNQKEIDALSRRIKIHQKPIEKYSNDQGSTEQIYFDFAEGLRHMLASLYGHTPNNLLYSTVALILSAEDEN